MSDDVVFKTGTFDKANLVSVSLEDMTASELRDHAVALRSVLAHWVARVTAIDAIAKRYHEALTSIEANNLCDCPDATWPNHNTNCPLRIARAALGAK